MREFAQPADWRWDAERPHAHWEEYRGHRFFVYFFEDRLVFQTDDDRFVLDSSYTSTLTRQHHLWMRFRLLKDGAVVYRFTYRDLQSRFWSILSAVAFMDDWWDWDTPFYFVHNHLRGTRPDDGASRPSASGTQSGSPATGG